MIFGVCHKIFVEILSETYEELVVIAEKVALELYKTY